MVEHRALRQPPARHRRARSGPARATACSPCTSVSFDIAVLGALRCRSRSARRWCWPAASDAAATAARLRRAARRDAASRRCQATPPTWRLLARRPAGRARRALKALCGGEALPRRAGRRACCEHAGAALVEPLRPDRDHVWSTTVPAAVGDRRRPSPIGRPIANTQAYVLDARRAAGARRRAGRALHRRRRRRARLPAAGRSSPPSASSPIPFARRRRRGSTAPATSARWRAGRRRSSSSAASTTR